nr:MAG TPA: hypothetical protein [Caudoviricetes sp.]
MKVCQGQIWEKGVKKGCFSGIFPKIKRFSPKSHGFFRKVLNILIKIIRLYCVVLCIFIYCIKLYIYYIIF